MTTPGTIQPYEAPGGVDLVPNPLAAARQSLREQAQMMADAKALADAMCASDMVPAIYRGKPGNGAAAILYGTEIGLNAIQSLQQIFIIHGKPGIEARVMVALVRNHGHKVQVVEEEDDRVVVRGLRKGDSADEAYFSEWTIERARKAGYAPDENGRGGNPKYDTNRREMLKAKAFADTCRTIAPDVLLGIAYTADELRDDPVHAQAVRLDNANITAPDWRTRFGVGSEAKAVESAVVDAAPVEQVAPAAETSLADGPILPPQKRSIGAALKKIGYTGEWSDFLSWLLVEDLIAATDGRKVESTNDLTTGEAGKVINRLGDPEAVARLLAAVTSVEQADTDSHGGAE